MTKEEIAKIIKPYLFRFNIEFILNAIKDIDDFHRQSNDNSVTYTINANDLSDEYKLGFVDNPKIIIGYNQPNCDFKAFCVLQDENNIQLDKNTGNAKELTILVNLKIEELYNRTTLRGDLYHELTHFYDNYFSLVLKNESVFNKYFCENAYIKY